MSETLVQDSALKQLLDKMVVSKQLSADDAAVLLAEHHATGNGSTATEEGVLQWGSPETRYKRGYITLRIPESVLLRVHRERELRAS